MNSNDTQFAMGADKDHLHLLAQHLPGVLFQFILYPDGRSAVPYSSPGIRDVYGVLPEEVEQDASLIFQRIHPEDLARFEQSIAASAQDLSVWKEEHRVILPDGRTIWLNGQATPERLNSGAVLWHGYIYDVTEVKQAWLLEQEKNEAFTAVARLRSILNSAPDGILQVDHQGRILAVNDAAESMFGYTRNELVGQNVSFLMPERFRQQHSHYLTRFAEVPHDEPMLTGRDGHVWAKDRWGREFPVTIAIGDIRDTTPPTYTAILRDISKELLLKEENEQQRALLEVLWQANNDFMLKRKISGVADYLLKHVIQLTKSEYGFIGEVLKDEQGNPYFVTHSITNIAWNEQTRSFYEKSAPNGLVFRDMDTLYGAVVVSQEVVISNEPKTDPRATGVPDGHPPLNHFLGVPIFHANELVGIYGLTNKPGGYSAQDVSFLMPFTRNYGALIQYKHMIEQQDSLNDALVKERLDAEKANRAKSEFLSSMSHELRTPLNSVLGFTQLVSRADNLSDMQRDSLYEIEKAGKHLLSLIGDVLDLAKIESGHIELSLEAVELAEVIDECVHLITPIAQERDIRLNVDCAQSWVVRADRVRLKQVIINLSTNAIKYNCDGGEVEIAFDQLDDKRLEIQVKDTGKGIPEDKRDLLFQPFNRLGQEGGTIEGTGVGLSISKTLVELMGGEIAYRPRKTGGSCFSVSLPMACMTSWAVNSESANTGLELQVKDKAKHILYIEDNPANLKLVAHILSQYDHIDLHTAHEPYLGLDMAMRHDFDLILLDINLPGMDGYQVLSRIRQTERIAQVPVFAVTANAMEQDMKKGKDAGFDAYLTKPIDLADFLQKISKVLG